MLKIRSYKSAFIVVLAAMMVITVVSVGSNAYRRAAEISYSLSTDVISEMSDKIVNRTVGIFEATHLYLETNATLFYAGRDHIQHRESLYRLFWRQLQLQPELLSIYAASPAGNLVQVRMQPQRVTRYIQRSDDKTVEQLIYRDRDYNPIATIDGGGLYDPLKASWYLGATDAGDKVHWSNIYRFSESGQAGVSAAKAVYDKDGNLDAVLGIDITLDSLSEFLATQRDTRGAIAMIIDSNDNLVAAPYQLAVKDSPEDEKAALRGIDNLADAWLVEAYRSLKLGGQQTESRLHSAFSGEPGSDDDYAIFSHDDARYLTHLHDFPASWGGKWQLFIVVPEASLLSATSRLMSESIIISLIILTGAVILASFLALRLFEPMRRLVHNTELIKQFRLDEVQPVASVFKEIESMDHAIISMRNGLQTLAKFLPAAVARDLIESGETPEPGGEVVDLTILFSAMAEFATLMKWLPPERVTSLLSLIIDEFTRTIHRSQGTIDNYLGESLMAFWGAPVHIPDGPQRACHSALQCVSIERELRRKNPESFPAETRNLFSIHRGPAIVGNIGSSNHMAYTAIGENVEFAWKLKQLNYRYGTRIIVSEPVHTLIADQFWLRRLDVIHLHENDTTMPIYELLGDRSQVLDNDVQEFVQSYEKGLTAIEKGNWKTAQSTFNKLAESHPDDLSVRFMRMRSMMKDAQLCPKLTASGAEVPDEMLQLPE